jgi:hypothetical protein
MISTVTSRILLYLRKHAQGGKKANFYTVFKQLQAFNALKKLYVIILFELPLAIRLLFEFYTYIPRYIQSLKHEKTDSVYSK